MMKMWSFNLLLIIKGYNDHIYFVFMTEYLWIVQIKKLSNCE